MDNPKVRFRIDPVLWKAALAVSKARNMDPGEYVSECIRMAQNAVPLIERAVELADEHASSVHEIGDQIRYIHSLIVADKIANQSALID